MARREAEAAAPATNPWPALAPAIAAYTALLLFRFRSAPGGLVNDAAEEAIRGLLLLEERRLEVMTFTIGNSAETLWLYIVGASAKLLGTTVLAVVLPSALAAAATLLLTTLLVRRLAPRTPLWIPLLLGAGSPWLFHYARSGFRAIAAPLFAAASGLVLARAQERPERRGPFALAGALVGLSLYAYTACRLLPIALALGLGAAVLRDRRTWARPALAALAGFALVSIPNALFFARHPAEFLGRGSYVLLGSATDRARNAAATALLPFVYPDRYRALAGPFHFFDGASAGLTSAGLDPVGPVAGVLLVVGLVARLARSRDLATLYLGFTLLGAVLLLGPAGPSLTRLLLVVPPLVAFASFGAAALATTRARRLAVAALLAAASVHAISRYFSRMGDPALASRAHAASAATAIGERARALSASCPVLCVVSANANVVRYLAWRRPVGIVEFYDRAFEPREVPAAPAVLVENVPELAGFRPPGLAEAAAGALFSEWGR